MSTPLNLKQVEKRMIWSYHQDGLLDIAIGISILAFGITILTDNDGLAGIIPVIILPFMMATKRKITIPRIGYVQFANAQKNKLSLLFTITLLLGVVMFLALSNQIVPEGFNAFMRQNSMAVFGGMLAIILVILATQMTTRLYVQAMITLICFWGGSWLKIEPPIFVMTAGILMLLVGFYTLVHFMQTHPLAEEANDS